MNETPSYWIWLLPFFCKQLCKPLEKCSGFETVYSVRRYLKRCEMATLVLTGFAIFLFLFFLLSFQSLLGWQALIRFTSRSVTRTSIILSVDPSQKLRINRSLRLEFRRSVEEEVLGTCVLVLLARIGAN